MTDLRPSQAAEKLGCSKTTVYEMLKAGEIQAYKLRGKHYRIPPKSIDDYRAKQCALLNSGENGRHMSQAKTAEKESGTPYVLPTTKKR